MTFFPTLIYREKYSIYIYRNDKTKERHRVTGVVKHLEPQGFERVTFFVTKGHRRSQKTKNIT
ncbi:Uncharacterised protein [Streptococcus pneumoniae]|nr:Uncharacterised protein [Streptococcus pneumoniae]